MFNEEAAAQTLFPVSIDTFQRRFFRDVIPILTRHEVIVINLVITILNKEATIILRI